MITIVRTLVLLSAAAVATPTLAHSTPRAFPERYNDFQAMSPYLAPQSNSLRSSPLGVDDEAHQTATGGPSGGIN